METLIQKTRETLSQGRLVAVIGWKDSNHSAFTRSIPSDCVLFLDSSTSQLGQNVGFVFFTKFNGHTDFERLRAGKDVHPIALGNGQIKAVFKSCRDIFTVRKLDSLYSKVSHRADNQQLCSTPDTPGVTEVVSDGLLDFLTQPQKEKRVMTHMEEFTAAFLEAAKLRPDGLVGSRTVGELRGTSGVTKTNPQLVAAGWIESVTGKDKSKIGWYRAGRNMEEVQNKKPETALPETPTGRLAHLIALKPTLIMDIEKLEAELTEKKAKLAMIDDAEAMILRINSAFL